MTDGSGGDDVVLVEARHGVLHIGLNRPAKRNAANRAMLAALTRAFTRLERDDDLRVGLVWAVGDHFTGGLDLADVGPGLASGGIDTGEAGGVDPWQVRGGPPRTKPVVVAVQGTCYTLGIELILACDITVAADSSVFGQIEVTRGLLPFGGATIRLPQVAGWGGAMRWLLTGETFDAAEALRMGLVQDVVPDGTELGTASAIAERIAAQAPLAVRATLASARLARDRGPEAAAAALPQAVARLAGTRDAAEGMRAFAERRDAVFTGR